MDKTLRGAVEMSAAMTILGTIGFFVVLSGQTAINVVFWRCAFGAIALLLICALQGMLRRQITFRQIAIAALGGVAIVVNWAMLFSAYGNTSIGVATAVYNTQPFILVGFGALFLAERLSAAKLLWLSVAFLGVVLIVQAEPADPATDGINYTFGIALALGAAFFLGSCRAPCKEARRNTAAADRADPGLRRDPDAGAICHLELPAR